MEAIELGKAPLAKKITIIPANPIYDFKVACLSKKIRRAAYARVSTDSEEQMTSYKAQVKYYTEILSTKEDTEFVGVYADEGFSGTNVAKRKGFQKLIADCRAGLIDEIWVKSISRFARNIVDCLQYIRELKELGINIHFESINVDTLDAKGELLIVILASIAEEESRNISENQKWRYKNDFAEGKMCISTLYGYLKDEHKQLVINPDTAHIVRRIYGEYLGGLSTTQIAERLNADGVPTYLKAKGKDAYRNTKWSAAGIQRMLENEKYKGDARLQKTFSPDFRSTKRLKNEGQVKIYEVENSHQPIIDRDTFDKVQAEIQRRKDLAASGERVGGRYSSANPLSGKIKCGECGDIYHRHPNKYKGETIPYWICKTKQRSKSADCKQPHIKEADIQRAFVTALNKLIDDKEAFIADLMKTASQIITDQDQSDYDRKADELTKARAEMLELNRASGKNLIEPTEYYEQSLKLMERIDALTAQTQSIRHIINTKKTAKHRLAEIQEVLSGEILGDFDGIVFRQLISMVTIISPIEVEFSFICGITVREKL